MKQSRIRCLAAMMAAALSACSGEAAPEPVEVAGPCADAFGAQLCTWATMEGDNVLDVGATVPLATIENAPGEIEMAWPPAAAATLDLPEAAQQASGLTHMTMYWEPTGHPPAVYMVPHFDFHFYGISPDDRLAIDCSDTSKPATLPDGYSLPDEVLPDEVAAMIGVSTLIGVCVPEMGMHSLLTAEIESGTPFRGTMVVGYYHNQPIFLEPMLTQALLRERQSFDLAIPALPGQDRAMPTTFNAVYDADQDAYRFTWSGIGTGY